MFRALRQSDPHESLNGVPAIGPGALAEIPDAQRISALYLGVKYGLSPTQALEVLKEIEVEHPDPKFRSLSLRMVQEWFREHGMGAPIRNEAVRMHKVNNMDVNQIYQNFQSRGESTPKLAIENWIATPKNRK